MARVITFFETTAFQTGSVYSEIFDVADVGRLDAELRVMALTGTTTPSITAAFETSSDPNADNAAWQPLGALTGGSPNTYRGAYSGLGQFVRAKMTMAATSGMGTASLRAIGRRL